jgi:hypothetical protein
MFVDRKVARETFLIDFSATLMAKKNKIISEDEGTKKGWKHLLTD